MAVHPINCSKHDLKGLFILSVVQNHDRVHAAEKAAQLLEDKNRQQEAAQKKANRAAKRARRDKRKNAQDKKESAPGAKKKFQLGLFSILKEFAAMPIKML
ncbi:hypothetical protein TRIUR3_09387 [Triticum urartu]|uniref:Uncharacterized protein n=1 Tax=Triticum urartu TaxID=4572 RepID=M7ZV87_TRIUA|nr:hypothetical protein TRIUR3_09387 [Triticum urartu]